MKKLKSRIAITCVSFIVSLLGACLTNQIVMRNPTTSETYVLLNIVYQMFFLNVFINGMIFIIDRILSFESNVTYFLVGILQVYLPIILVGGVIFVFFPLSIKNIGYMAILSIAIYLIVMGIVFAKNKSDEQIINEKLRKGKV